MKIMGLDLSLTSTGYAVDGKIGVISTKHRGGQRLSVITKSVLDLCLDEKISCVIIEGYSFASRNSQAHSIGELGGCIRMMLWENKIPYVEIPPTSRAKFATGRGNSAKTEVISSISAMTGLVFSGSGSDDMCDAWILREMGMAYMSASGYTWPKINMTALEKIDWSPLEESIEQAQ
jgi:crossover junction endodeoxyribonuclease RuvC